MKKKEMIPTFRDFIDDFTRHRHIIMQVNLQLAICITTFSTLH